MYKGGLILAIRRRMGKMGRISEELLLTERAAGLGVSGVALPSFYP